jgi:predicted house-cleaning NTP pyrophosphatase (Maf/HAM1 superfamily)
MRGPAANAIIIIRYAITKASRDRCKAITLEALQSNGAVAIIIAVSLAELERKLTSRWGKSKIFQFRIDAIIITRYAITGASRDRCKAITLEALQSNGAVDIIIAVSLA